MEAKKIGPRSKTTQCVSSSAAATAAAVATLVREMGEFLEANPSATLDVSVSGAAGGALATELQKIGKVTKATTVPGANATTTLDAVVVARSKAGVALERVRSTTCIVPIVQNMSEYDVAVLKASVVLTTSSGGKVIVRSKITAPQEFVDGVAVNGATGVWVSRNAYAVWALTAWWAYYFDDTSYSGAYAKFMGAEDLPSADSIKSRTGGADGTRFTWTGTLPPAEYFEIDDGS